jgi:hypothetical protein
MGNLCSFCLLIIATNEVEDATKAHGESPVSL